VALLLKHLHKFYNNDPTPWAQLIRDSYYYRAVSHAVVPSGSFWWRNICTLTDAYRAITKCEVGNGTSVLFWSDNWQEQQLQTSFPRLFSFAKDKLQSVCEFMQPDNPIDNFHIPLSVEAFEELSILSAMLRDVSLVNEANDKWVCKLGKGIFKPSLVYQLHFHDIPVHRPSCWIWTSKCMSKHKFFAWLILHDRINTKDMLLRRHWNVTDMHSCILCHADIREDWRHLFFNCQFSTHIWNYLQISWDLGPTLDVIGAARKRFKGHCFYEITILDCWCIWKQRNGWIFNGITPSFRSWKASFVYEISLLMHRVKPIFVSFLSSWLDNLP
jgi:hypothetical protein